MWHELKKKVSNARVVSSDCKLISFPLVSHSNYIPIHPYHSLSLRRRYFSERRRFEEIFFTALNDL